MQCEVVLNFIISILGLIEVIAPPPHEVAYIFRYQNFAFEYSPPPHNLSENHTYLPSAGFPISIWNFRDCISGDILR